MTRMLQKEAFSEQQQAFTHPNNEDEEFRTTNVTLIEVKGKKKTDHMAPIGDTANNVDSKKLTFYWYKSGKYDLLSG